jgi:hypothetical protein
MYSRNIFVLFFVLVLGLNFSACVDQEFDEPPVRGLSDLSDKVNMTIAELKALHTLGSDATPITEDKVIRGIVVADDRSGNFYQQIVIEDETGGIVIRLGANGLFGLFPEGTEVFVQLQGLYINDFNNLYQIAGDSEGNVIANALISQYVSAGEDKGAVPTPVSLAELLNNPATFDTYLSRLVVMEDIEFADFELGATYGDLSTGFSAENRTIQDCAGNSAIVRNSNFADFADELLPEGRGDLTAIVSVFGTTVQFLIRDEGDVNFSGDRCGSGPIGGDLIDISALRSAYAGGATTAPANSKIRGVVISDRINGNFNSQNIVIQDNSGGIVVRFAGDHSFNLGEELEINVSSQDLGDFNGLVQVSNVPLTAAQSQGEGTLPDPRVATVSELLANGAAWESTLVQVEGATITGGPTWGDGATIGDGTGSLNVFTFFSASFSDDAIPTGEGTLTAVLSTFNGLQLNIRNRNDIDFEGGGGGGEVTEVTAAELRDLFNGGATSAPAARKLRGVVISDTDNGNTTGRNLVLQDASGGIVIRFSDNHNFALGEDIEIVVSGLELSEFNGLLQVNNVPNTNAVSYGNGTLPEPRVATIREVLDNAEAWESTLVRINDISLTEGGTWNGGKVLTDGSDQIDIFTRSQASFSSAAVPAGNFSIIAIVSEFNEPQVLIRNLSDIIE